MFSNKLKALRKEARITQEQLAAAIGVERSSVGKYEGKSKVIPSHEVLTSIANYFNVSVDYLLGNDIAPTPKRGVKIPVLGHVAAGIPVEAIQDILDYEEITEEMASTGDFFALRIKGDSMEPRIRDGDVVIVRQQPDVESGQIAIVLVNGDDATCKKYMQHDNGISLVSFNPSYAPIFYTIDEIENKPVQIIGRVVELRGKF